MQHQVYGKYSIRVHHDPNEKFGSKHVCKILDGQCRCKCHSGPFYWKPETWMTKETHAAYKKLSATKQKKLAASEQLRGPIKQTSGHVYAQKRTDYDDANNLKWFGYVHGPKDHTPEALPWMNRVA